MLPKSNPVARQLSSMPKTHRASTLQAISDSAHAISSKIEILRAEQKKVSEILNTIPADATSRLQWLSNNLQEL